jgi:DNA-binding GntR family transcriptional regulator
MSGAGRSDGNVLYLTSGGSVTSQVCDHVRHDILNGSLAPGLKLKIEALRDMYGAGASPLREALSLLTSEGLVERLDQRGFRVAGVSVEGFDELLKTRCWVEEKAIRESLAQGDQEWEETIVLAHHRLKRTPRKANAPASENAEWEAAHKHFHLSLISACGSSLLLGFCERLYDFNIRYRNIAGQTRTGPASNGRSVADEHQGIFDAAIARDADHAVELLLSHYRNTGKELSRALAVV